MASRKRGFTLTEVLAAIVLVGVAATVVAASMPISNVGRARANYLNRAAGLAQKQLEAIRGAGYSNATASQLASLGLIDSATAVSTNTYAFTNSDAVSLDNPAKVLPSGTGTVMVEQVDLDLRRVTVKVQWMERDTARTFTLGTLVANL